MTASGNDDHYNWENESKFFSVDVALKRKRDDSTFQQSLAIRAWMVAIKDSLAETSPKGFLLSFAILRRGGCSLFSFQCQLYFTKLICYYTDSVTVPFNVVSSGYSLWGYGWVCTGHIVSYSFSIVEMEM